WTQADADFFRNDLMYYFYASNTTTDRPIFWLNMQYAIGEGAGADFVNKYLTLPAYGDRLAGIATIGAQVAPTVADDSIPMPAYIIGDGTNGVAEAYYKTVNEATIEGSINGNPMTYNSIDRVKKVVVNSANITTFDKNTVLDAYYSVFRWSSRGSLYTRVFDDFYTDEILTLWERPDVDELDLSMFESYFPGTSDEDERWYEWVPNEALTDSGETFPLVITLHGNGDHPIYEGESNGWVKLAGQERFIVVSPEPANTASADYLNQLLDELIDKYPVDESRIYFTSFSGGAVGLYNLIATKDNVERLAAVAPMTSAGGVFRFADDMDEVDLPYMYTLGTNDSNTTTDGKLGGRTGSDGRPNQFTSLETIFALNNINMPEGWYEGDTFWLFDELPESTVYTNQHDIVYETIQYYKDDMPLINLTTSEGPGGGLDHIHYVGNAEVIWGYLSQFSRDVDTKEIIWQDSSDQLIDGAKFHEIGGADDLGVENSQAFIYVASELNDPGPMLTPVLYVYPDAPLANEQAAWNAMKEMGLQQLAEEEHAAVILVNPTGDTWGEIDVEVFEGLNKYVFYSNDFPGYNLTYANLQYVISEGSGATFVNEYLTQSTKRIAGIATVNGEGTMPGDGVAVPAYIVNGTEDAISYYNTVNGTDSNDGDISYNSEDPVKKV
ncbi:MAG: hypothetical protein ACRDBM_04265, partial [Sporomusa sp.]